jgi:hypothetical protein
VIALLDTAHKHLDPMDGIVAAIDVDVDVGLSLLPLSRINVIDVKSFNLSGSPDIGDAGLSGGG